MRAFRRPAAVKREAVRSVVNWLGCAIGACHHEAVACALEAFALSGSREASVLGREEKVDILLASLLNGISSHVFDFDDTHLKTIIHPRAR
jgi:2-methylcitrate dehydratase PrpD